MAAPRARMALVGLLFGTAGLAMVAAGPARQLFIVGCAWVGYLAWREGCGRTIEVAISLYAFAPLLRRLVDLGAGFDPSGSMLVGPVLAIAVPTIELRHLLLRREKADAALLPWLLVGACITYGMMLSAFAGEFAPLGTAALKMYTPLLYGAWVMRCARRDPAVLDAAVNAFMFVAPVIGAYAVWQYVSPSNWDRFWMLNVSGTISVLGRPEPFQVRVFSTMNSPASFGTYAACSLLLFGFCRRGWQALPLMLLVAPGLLFTYYRTAWLSLALGLAYCAVSGRTRERAGLIALVLVAAVALATASADFGDAVADRLGTLTGSVAEDGSGKARLGQLFEVYRLVDSMCSGCSQPSPRHSRRCSGWQSRCLEAEQPMVRQQTFRLARWMACAALIALSVWSLSASPSQANPRRAADFTPSLGSTRTSARTRMASRTRSRPCWRTWAWRTCAKARRRTMRRWPTSQRSAGWAPRST